jgi:hypothetical protein
MDYRLGLCEKWLIFLSIENVLPLVILRHEHAYFINFMGDCGYFFGENHFLRILLDKNIGQSTVKGT